MNAPEKEKKETHFYQSKYLYASFFSFIKEQLQNHRIDDNTVLSVEFLFANHITSGIYTSDENITRHACLLLK